MNQEIKERAEQNGNRCASAMDVTYNDGTREVGYGLTKREYMSIHILAGMMANCATFDWTTHIQRSVEMADELLEELEKTK